MDRYADIYTYIHRYRYQQVHAAMVEQTAAVNHQLAAATVSPEQVLSKLNLS